MSNSIPTASPTRKPTHWPSVAMVVLGLGGILFLLSIAGGGFVGGIYSLLATINAPVDTPQLFSYAVGGIFLSLLLLPTVVMSIRRLGGHSGEKLPAFFERIVQALHPQRSMMLYPLVILAGWWLGRYPAVNWVFMPLLNMLALSLPAAWLVWVGTRDFEPRSAHRNWSALGVGMTFAPGLIFVLELAVMIIGIVLIIVAAMMISASTNPIFQELALVLEQFGSAGEVSEQAVNYLLQNPVVIGIMLLFLSGIVPVIEEIFKPMAVWALWNRPLTPQDGWTLGLLSGAGFALMENFGNVSVGAGWTFIALARGGATALHMFNTALIGYTFALARQKKQKLLPFLALAIAMLVHAAWNAMTVFAMAGSVDMPLESEIWPVRYIVLMALMSLSLVAGVVFVNRRLARSAGETAATGADETGEPVEGSEN